jgi:hypothetical protein
MLKLTLELQAEIQWKLSCAGYAVIKMRTNLGGTATDSRPRLEVCFFIPKIGCLTIKVRKLQEFMYTCMLKIKGGVKMLKVNSGAKVKEILSGCKDFYVSEGEIAVSGDICDAAYSGGKEYFEYLYSMKTNDVNYDSDYCAAFMMF